MPICSGCQLEKSESEMVADNGRRHRNGWITGECKPCKRSRQRAAHAADPTIHKNAMLRSRYGIDLAEYRRLILLQEGLCAVCKKPPKSGELHIDHDHITRRVRGLLCARCNIMIDWAVGYADKARAYLEAAQTLVIRMKEPVRKRTKTWVRPDRRLNRGKRLKRRRGGVHTEEQEPEVERAVLASRLSS